MEMSTEQMSPQQIETTHQILDVLGQYVDKGGTHAEFVALLEDTSRWLQGLTGGRTSRNSPPTGSALIPTKHLRQRLPVRLLLESPAT
jgi:hypothetical protein